MACSPAPACKAVLSQASARWPLRSRLSDGICPSPEHSAQNPTSDHEQGNAADLTHDPAHGCDAHAWAESLRVRRDRRVLYIISRSRIAASYPVASWPAWAWRPYSGPNDHTKHAHVSIKPEFRGDVAAWFDVPAPAPPAPVQLQEDDMPLIVWDPNTAWLVDGGRKVRIDDPAEKDALKAAGVKEVVAPKLVARTPEAV